MSKVFDAVWKTWLPREEGHDGPLDPFEKSWLIELNLAVFSRVEEELEKRGQKLFVAPAPQFLFENKEVTMWTRRLRLFPHEDFELQVTAAVESILFIIKDKLVTFIYAPVFPMGRTWFGGIPNRVGMGIRINTL